MPLTQDTLKFEATKDGVDLDKILRDAATKTIKHVDIWLPQDLILSDEDYGMSFEGGVSSPELKLSPSVLEKFLEGQQGNLVSFQFRVDDCCWAEVAKMTNNGRAFLPLARIESLEKLVFSSFSFPNISDLSTILRPLTNLKELGLRFMVIGGIDPCAWPRSACTELASSISGLSQLVKLEINDAFFVDDDVGKMFSGGLKSLRCLTLSGSFGDLSEGGSNLTNRTCTIIGAKCSNLQALNLEYQNLTTEEGVRIILEHCLHLRELNVTRAKLTSNLSNLLKGSSNKLLLMHVGSSVPPRSLRDGMVATNGRLMFVTERQGLVEPPANVRAAHEESKKLVEDAGDKLEDPSVYNEWEDLF